MLKKTIKGVGLVFTVLVVLLLLFLIVSYVNHRIELKKEESIYICKGQLVEVNGHKMNVYTEGSGEKTLVFMSGGATCSPVLDFKSLYSILSPKYKIVVVEKSGYGFSDDSNVPRDIDNILQETRQALALANITGPFVLVPHSMSGIEALYWAQQYPDEVECIIGLDMAVPSAYENMDINVGSLKMISIVSKLGITRFLPSVAQGECVKYGTLTEDEKQLYKAIFYRKTWTKPMINEVIEIKSNAEKVNKGQSVDVPMIIFSSNGIGTGYDKDKWKKFHQDFEEQGENRKVINLESPHYIHNHEYILISVEIDQFLQEISTTPRNY